MGFPSFMAVSLGDAAFLPGVHASFPCSCPCWLLAGQSPWPPQRQVLAQCAEGRGQSRALPQGCVSAAAERGRQQLLLGFILGTVCPVRRGEGPVLAVEPVAWGLRVTCF